LRNDEGLHQLVPYFTKFIAEEVVKNITNLAVLRSLMQMSHALASSPYLQLDSYLHQLVPVVMSCIVAKRLCLNPNEDHWSLRDFAANLLALICKKFGTTYAHLQSRVTQQLLRAFLEPNKPLTTHYGAIVALASLGPFVTKTLLLPHLRLYMSFLEPAIEKAQNPIKRMESINCYGALLRAVGDHVKQECMRNASLFVSSSSNLSVSTTTNNSDSFGNSNNNNNNSSDDTSGANRMNGISSNNKKLEKDTTRRKALTSLEVDDNIHPSHSNNLNESQLTMDDLFDIFGESLLPYIFSRHIMQPSFSESFL